MHLPVDSFFFFNDTATTEIYTLSLHDALPISARPPGVGDGGRPCRRDAARQESARERGAVRAAAGDRAHARGREDRKSTRLNSSHGYISYAVFCLKKKTNTVATLITIVLAVYI